MKAPLAAGLILFVPLMASAGPNRPTPGMRGEEQRILGLLRPEAKAKVGIYADRYLHLVYAASSNGAASPKAMSIQNMGVLPPGGDIAEMCFVVLMEATNDQDSDLELIMAETKALTNAKQALRQLMAQINSDVAKDASRQTNNRSSTRFGMPYYKAQPVPPMPHSLTATEKKAFEERVQGLISYTDQAIPYNQIRMQILTEERDTALQWISSFMKKSSRANDEILKNLKG
jgi:hypothetical protein